MSSKNKSQLRTENSNNFPNNNSQFITPEKLRDFNNDVIDSMVVNQDTGSYLLTSSFDTGSRDLTFTRVDGTIYSNNIPGGAGGSIDTGSLLVTASVVDATITYTKGNGDVFTNTINNVANAVSASSAVSASHAEFADQATEAEDLFVTVKNTSGGTINKGLAVHATGVTGENINVILADSSTPASMPAIGLLEETLTNNSVGRAIINGRLKNVDTSGLSAGANIFVNGAGTLTVNKPTGSDEIQSIGVAGKIDASEGEIIIQGAGRVNALPNITDGYGWFGNTNGVATAQTTSSFAKTDIDNTFTGTQNFLNISVSGTGSFGRIEAVTGSAKIIGDAFVVVNADTPTLRYAGLQVYDSGSSSTASIEWDGGNDSWILVEEGGQSSFLLTGPTGSKGSEVNLTENTLPKAGVHRQLVDSIISDDGANVTVSGNINVTGNYNGFDSGSFALLGASNTFTGGTQVADSANGLFYSKPDYPSSGFVQKKLWDLNNQNIPVQSGVYNIYQNSFTHFNGYGRWYENGSYLFEAYDGGSYNYGNEISFNGGGTQLFAIASGSGGLGSGNHAKIVIQDDYNTKTSIDIQSQGINIGNSTNGRLVATDGINIGSTSSPVNISSSGLIVSSSTTGWNGNLDITGNLTVTGTIGGIDSGSFALKNAANTFTAGPQLVSGSTGYVTQQFTAPAANNEYPQTTLVGASNGGTAYNRVFQGVMDYSNFGLPYLEDAFAIEYFDSLSYGYGSQFYLNGKSTELGVTPNGGGSSNIAKIKLQDVGDNTSNMELKATTLSLGTNTNVLSTGLGNNSNTTIIQGNNVNFNGNTHTFSNSTVISGSVQSAVDTITISSNTASLDFNGPQLQTLELVSGSETRLEATNTKDGVTINLQVKQPSVGFGTLVIPNFPFKEPTDSHYSASQAVDAIDILTFIRYNTNDIFVANVKNFN
jgi:hypothetical protein